VLSEQSWDISPLRLFALTAALLILHGAPACAHKLKVFATADGKTISGYAYYSGGARPRSVTIQLVGPNGEKLGKTRTNEKGEFTFEAGYKCDHIVTIDTGDGHGANWTVHANELPDDLPLLGRSNSGSPPDAAAGDKPDKPASQDKDGDAPPLSDIERAVADAVSKEIGPLRTQINKYREEIQKYQEKIRLHDILGGIGYIAGVAGLAFYFLGRRTGKGRRPAARRDNGRTSQQEQP